MRSGWRNVVDAIVALLALGLLPEDLLALAPGFDESGPRVVLPRVFRGTEAVQQPGLLSTFSSLLSFGASPAPAAAASGADGADTATATARDTIASCRIGQLLASAPALSHDALVFFLGAVVKAATTSGSLPSLDDDPAASAPPRELSLIHI